jgi:hypothetical protein
MKGISWIKLEKGIYFGNYHSEQIFLSPEGIIKIYAYSIKPEGKLNLY